MPDAKSYKPAHGGYPGEVVVSSAPFEAVAYFVYDEETDSMFGVLILDED